MTSEDARFWSTERVEHARIPTPRPLLAVVAIAVVLAGMGIAYATTRHDARPPDTQVLGERLANPPATDPQASTATASLTADGQVLVAETWVWPDGIPSTIDVRPPSVTGLAGIPHDAQVSMSRPEASVDGNPIKITAAFDGSWRLSVPAGAGHGVVLVRYHLTGALHKDPQSPPGRALAVVALAPQTSAAGAPRQLILPTANVLNVACPTANGGPVVLCATRKASSWVVTLPPGGSVALAQLDLTS